MPTLRDKAKAAGLGSRGPSWESKGLGLAAKKPEAIISGLGLSGFKGRGDDWMQDVYDVLLTATRSIYLRDLYSAPSIFRNQKMVALNAASDLYGYSTAVMRRMIMSTLWAAELTGRVALPAKLKVEITSDKRGIMITVD